MTQSLSEQDLNSIFSDLATANHAFSQQYPGDSQHRQPVHTVYGGAQLFKSGYAKKLGSLALRALDTYAANYATFAQILGIPGAEKLPQTEAEVNQLTELLEKDVNAMKTAYPEAWLAYTVYQRVRKKLESEPIEDNRIDFEDGYGNRKDEEEDAHAIQAATELAKAMEEGTVSPFIGFRIKSFTEECRKRSARTLDLFLTQLSEKTGGKLPENFVVTLPKVTIPEQVTALVRLLEKIEEKTEIAKGALRLEIMIETTQAIVDSQGRNAVPLLVDAGEGRCVAAIFGTYDYTASCNITAAYQTHTHAACDFARHIMQVSLAKSGVNIVDGATTLMPIGPHKSKETPLTNQQVKENMQVINSAWKLHFENILHSLSHAYYQGWDLNPAQLPIRYAAVYTFFLMGLDDASKRLHAFLAKAAQATLVGHTFDDAATGQGLLNFFLRGISCGAITEEETLATGITLDELSSRSFVQIINNRTA